MSTDIVSQSIQRPPRGLRAWTRARAHSHLYRNGYALIASSGLTSALGLVFWVLAARSYSAVAVGVGSALIAAMTTIANLCHLNLKSALNRFLPSAGGATRRMVVRSYVVAVVVSGLVSLVFVAGLHLWSPRLAFLIDRPGLGAWFVMATMAWTIFVLQDNVLTGIRQAVWVPLENLTFGLIKLALLPALVISAPLLGTFVAWTAALPVLLLAVNVPLFRWLLPQHVRATEAREERVGVRDIVRYVASDYVAYVVMTATIGLLPLVVLATLGARANAYYFVSWSIAYGLYLIAGSMGMSMITEAVHDPGSFARYRRQALVETAKLVMPCVGVVVLAAPWIMGLLGHGYPRAAALLRLLSLSAVPWIVFVTYTNAARVQRRMRVVVAANVALFGLVLAIGLPLLAPLGINGLGVGWLAAQSIVATAILAGQVARDWHGEISRSAVRALAAFRSRLRGAAIDGVRRDVLAEVRLGPGCSDWIVHRDLPVLNDVAVSLVGPPDTTSVAVVRSARSDGGRESIRAHAENLQALRDDPVLADFNAIRSRLVGVRCFDALVPDLIAVRNSPRYSFAVETCKPGATMESLLREGLGPSTLLAQAVRAITPLHEATRTPRRVDARLLDDLVDVPLARLRGVARRHSRLAHAELAVDHLQAVLHSALAGREVGTSRTHGDYSPTNILVGDDGTVQGIVDWESGRAHGLSQLDLLQLLISTRVSSERRELGAVVTELLARPGWRESERPVIDALGTPALSTRALVTLAWLHHVSANIAKSSRYAASRLWVRRNIDPVLAVLCPGAAPAVSDRGAAVPADKQRTPIRVQIPPATRGVAHRLRSIVTVVRRAGVVELAPVGGAVVFWVLSLPHIAPRAMTDLGLISVLPYTFLLALLILTVSFVSLLHRRSLRIPALAAHLLALVAFVHATPTIVYGTLRYSWAWKHVGIVDYIVRHGAVDPGIRYQSVYHNWPGFFGFDTLFSEVAGFRDALAVAIWGPVFNNVLFLGALLFLFYGLTDDRRTAWLACWLFLIADWVGQDYFSPQAFAFTLYLLLLGVVVRWLARRAPTQPLSRGPTLALSVLLLAAIAPVHALTSVMACLALTALVLTGMCRARFLPLVAAALTVSWDRIFAWDFVSHDLSSTLREVNLPWDTTSATLTNVGRLSADQAMVAHVARGLSVVIIAMAVVGALRQARAGQLVRTAPVLAVAPLALYATGNYDGELLFRIYLFAVPFLAFLAAHALLGWRRSISAALTTAALTSVLGAFLIAYYGKERLNYFTPQEVAAARYVDTHAPPDSLLIDGTNNYPFAFKNYERFVYVSIAREPAASSSRVIAHPAAVLASWMSAPAYRAAYVIITRSQEIEVESDGVMPPGSLAAIDRALLSSPRFRVVFRDRDATVFSLVRPGAGVKS